MFIKKLEKILGRDIFPKKGGRPISPQFKGIRAGHALMKRPDKELSDNKAINEAAELVKEVEIILEREY